MATGPLERHPISTAANAAVGDRLLAAAVDGDELLDAVLVFPLLHEELRAAQVPLPFLSDVGDEEDVVHGPVLRHVHGTHQLQHQRDAAGVVADAGGHQAVSLALDLHVGAFGKDGVHVREDGEHLVAAAAATHAHHVAFGVHLDVRELELLHHAEDRLAARLLLERRGGDLGQGDQLTDEAIVVLLEKPCGGLEGAIVDERLDGRWRRLRTGGDRGGQKDCEECGSKSHPHSLVIAGESGLAERVSA